MPLHVLDLFSGIGGFSLGLEAAGSFLTIVTPASSRNLTTLAQVKAELSLTDTAQDIAILAIIKQTSAQIESYCKVRFAQETLRETIRPRFAHDCFMLRRYPVSEIVSITENDETLQPSAYETEKETGFVFRLDAQGDRQLWAAGKIIITYKAGYILPDAPNADLPDSIERAVIELCKSLYFNKERNPMIRSETVEGIGSTSYLDPEANTGGMPMIVADLLSPYRNIAL